ncbi:DNA primase [Campylobacter curvus]|uniref:DNA primase n=1 Tax=Campylobacter curvus TaxID=200 RepID=UPI00146FEB4F|nr:CHC2 zinc finger domain-containing protein [Campylobacter curvus]
MITNLDELKIKADIVDVISNYLPVQKAGANFTAICPFHADTKPSLMISPSKGIYHCFACGAGGDAIKFVSEYKKLNFEESCEEIADIIGFNLIKDDKGYKKRDISALERAKDTYKQNLYKVKNYLLDRGVNDETMAIYELGYGINLNDVSFEEKRYYGLGNFTDRLVFPIKTHTGRVVGFGARSLEKEPKAKYINSPNSEIFNKSALFYGFDVAKKEIIKTREVVICEGYMDTIMAYQAGIKNIVATLGVALTKEHLASLCKLGTRITLSFDMDNAGKKATLKAIELLCLNRMYDASVLKINSKFKDIADIVKAGDIHSLQSATKEPIIKFYCDFLMSGFENASSEERALKVANAAKFLNSLDNNFLKREYETYIIQGYGLNAEDLQIRGIKREKTTRHYDVLEVALIKLMSASKENKDYVLGFLSENEFRTTKEAFLAIKNNENNGFLREILFMQTPSIDIETAARTLYRNKLHRLLENVSKDKSLSEEERLRMMNKIKTALRDFRSL